jgi:hypothetical protein
MIPAHAVSGAAHRHTFTKTFFHVVLGISAHFQALAQRA